VDVQNYELLLKVTVDLDCGIFDYGNVLYSILYVTCTVHFQLYISYADKCTQFYVILTQLLLSNAAQHVSSLYKAHLQGLFR
jgi:hypothetical protein